MDQSLPTIHDLDTLVRLVEEAGPGEDLYVRWSKGPDADASSGEASRDSLTGVALPGLSANPLTVEDWWRGHSTHLWVARKLHDYRHLREVHGPGVRPWLLVGTERGRGPDNEPLVTCRRPVAWIAESVLAASAALVADETGRHPGALSRSSRG
jgi:hypothetical protein